jgi:hypothetical protein
MSIFQNSEKDTRKGGTLEVLGGWKNGLRGLLG